MSDTLTSTCQECGQVTLLDSICGECEKCYKCCVVCGNCENCESICECHMCGNCDNKVEFLCSNCGKCEECCECYSCEYCSENVDHVCDNCSMCVECCDCFYCESGDHHVDRDEGFCGHCGQCDECCECVICENCGDAMESICSDCNCCYAECCECQRNIYDYEYTPEQWNFDGFTYATYNKLYMGIELEFSNWADDIAEQDIFANNKGLFFFKEDGSVPNGAELVTHPCTLEYHREKVNWNSVLKELRSRGCKSHDTTTCGLHVHVEKRNIKNIDQIKLGLFVYSNVEALTKLARREPNDYCLSKDVNYIDKTRVNKDCARYEMINFTNLYTLEFRMFRGTLNEDSLMACIEFCHAVVHWVKTVNVLDILKSSAWASFVEYAKANGYACLVVYMQQRGIVI